MAESNAAARSPALRLVEIEGKGRGFIAAESLKGGQIILRESPLLVFSSYPWQRRDNQERSSSYPRYCAHCYMNLSAGNASVEKTAFTCPVCSHPDDATFCSSRCLSLALNSSHSPYVCLALRNLRTCSSLLDDQPEERQVQARYLVSAYNLAMVSPSSFRTLLSLYGDGERYLDAATFLHWVISPPSLPEVLPDVSVELTAALLDKETCNSFNLMEPYLESRERGIRAYGIYPNVSFFNHSCIPNACRFEYLDTADDGNTDIIIRTIHDVPQGQEVCLSYVRVNRDYSDRKYRLQNYFGFSCFCDRCKVENNSELNRVQGDESYYGKFLAQIICDKDNCGGTLAPLPPANENSYDLMESNYCGEIKNHSRSFRFQVRGLRTWNEHEEINDTSLSSELFCGIGRSRSLVSTRTFGTS